MKVKTYGVPGLTEWHGKLKAGSIEVAVSFTGGTASPSGAQPAYFMTKDPIVQFVIENSKEFKDGFIILVMSQEVAGVHPRMAVPKPVPSPQVGVAAKECQKGMVSGTPDMPIMEGQCVADSSSESSVTSASEPSSGEQENEHPQDDGDEAGEDDVDTAIHVADKPDAIEYLKEHFPDKGYTATSLRTKSAFESACKECGVEFVFA